MQVAGAESMVGELMWGARAGIGGGELLKGTNAGKYSGERAAGVGSSADNQYNEIVRGACANTQCGG